MWVGGSIKSFIIANTPPPVSTIPHGQRQAARRRTASGRRPAARRAMWAMWAMWALWAMWPANSDRQETGQAASSRAPAAASYRAMYWPAIGPAAASRRPNA